MRWEEEIKVPSTTKKLRHVKCDFCGAEARDDSETPDWSKDSYDVAETGVYMKTGSSYPDGGDSHYLELHACVKCFSSKVKPALEALGVKFSERYINF